MEPPPPPSPPRASASTSPDPASDPASATARTSASVSPFTPDQPLLNPFDGMFQIEGDRDFSQPLITSTPIRPPPLSLELYPFMSDQDWNQEMGIPAYAVYRDPRAPEVQEDDQRLRFLAAELQVDPNAHEDIDLEEVLARRGIYEGHICWDFWEPYVEYHRALRAAVDSVSECPICGEKFLPD